MKIGVNWRQVIIGVLLGLAAIYMYQRNQMRERREQLARYDYLPNAHIDYEFYNQDLLHTYMINCDQLTDMAAQQWLRHGIDIRTDSTGEYLSTHRRFLSLLHYTQSMEARLTESRDLKEQGLTNDVIELILNKGITIGAVEAEKDKMAACEFLKGKNAGALSKPVEIWELQKLLNANDYVIPINGIYTPSTDSALSDFQQIHGLYISHCCDDITLLKLAE